MTVEQQILTRLGRLEEQNQQLLALLAKLTGQQGETMVPVDADAIRYLARQTAKYGKGVLHDFNARR